MDQLDIDAKAASDMGVSYGKYMAIHKDRSVAEPVRRKPPAKKKEPDRPRCQVCGKEIPEGSRRKVTCSAACADIRKLQQHEKWKEAQASK